MWRRILFLSFLLVTACQEAAPAQPAATEGGETAVSTLPPAPTNTPSLDTPVPDETAAPQTEPTATAPAATAAPVEETAVLPAPTLFETSWDDRSLYASGLLESEQAILQDLPGATIYHMALTVEPNLTTVTGWQEVRYTNTESVPLEEVYFHLFPNLLGGSLIVEDVLVNGAMGQASLEDANSLLNVDLPETLPPNGQVVIRMAFRTTIPQELGRNYGIFAYADDILALAHFYPMVSVYDDETWNIAQPAEGGDVTYGDTSFYLVRITTPANQMVVSSGVPVAHSEQDEVQTIEIAAGPMRDFYLATSQRYVLTQETVDGIQINSYAPPEMANGSQLALETAVSAIKSFNGRFAPYPYTELDIVTTSTLALGVEYPGIIANAIRMYDDGSGQPNRNFLESTTAHEVAHQWFYGLVGNDQLDEPWLDESVTQYATWLYYVDRYGEQGAQGFYQALLSRWNSTGQAAVPLGLPVHDYSAVEYSSIIYGRGAIFVDELAQEVGVETFEQFLKAYQETFRWEIASTEAFQALLEQTCQCELDERFAKDVYGTN